jgi:hypothetical protein
MGMRIGRLMVVVAVLAVGMGGCGKPFGGRVVYQGDYPSYQSVAEMVEKATLVVEATVARPRVDKLYPSDSGGTDPRANPQAGAPEADDDTGIVITVWSATITAVHKGINKPGDVVDVKQMGGEFDGVVYEQPGQVAFREGTTYLLFLETYPDAAASLLNPTQAQYEVVQDGSYRPVSADNRITIDKQDL